jgi:hypothetical protein
LPVAQVRAPLLPRDLLLAAFFQPELFCVQGGTPAPFYNFAKGNQGLFRQPQGQKQMAVSVRCVRE